jgi:hypothetical protein
MDLASTCGATPIGWTDHANAIQGGTKTMSTGLAGYDGQLAGVGGQLSGELSVVPSQTSLAIHLHMRRTGSMASWARPTSGPL